VALDTLRLLGPQLSHSIAPSSTTSIGRQRWANGSTNRAAFRARSQRAGKGITAGSTPCNECRENRYTLADVEDP
jgi:hypothetical protein